MLVDFLKKSWLVMVSALVFGLLVASVNGMLEDRINENKQKKLNREMQSLLTIAQTFEKNEDMQFYTGKDSDGTIVGYAIEAEGGGFADKIGLLIAVDVSLENILGIAILQSNETPGFGDAAKGPTFRNQFVGAPASKLGVVKDGNREAIDETIVAITGATITSEAVVKIVNDAVTAMKEKIK